MTISIEELPGIALVTSPPEDPVDRVHREIRAATVAHTARLVDLVRGLLTEDAPPHTVGRALHLLEGLAQAQAQLLSVLGVARGSRKRRSSIYTSGSVDLTSGYGGLEVDDDEGDPETYTGAAQAETFGNKALQQVVAMFKPLIQEGGMLGLTQKAKSVNAGAEVESLTTALAAAKKAKLGAAVTGPIEAKLKVALGVAPIAVLGALPAKEVKP